MTIQKDSVVAGEFAVVTIAVPHGCDGSSTTAVRIQMPETIPAVTPTINAGWDVEILADGQDPFELEKPSPCS